MKNKVLKLITDYSTKELNDAYGYCSVAASDEQAYINSEDREGNNIEIVIKLGNGKQIFKDQLN